MKHFRISIISGRTMFVAECSTVAEAWDILRDAAMLFPMSKIHESADEFIALLVDMKNGKTKRYEGNHLFIEYLDGEV